MNHLICVGSWSGHACLSFPSKHIFDQAFSIDQPLFQALKTEVEFAERRKNGNFMRCKNSQK